MTPTFFGEKSLSADTAATFSVVRPKRARRTTTTRIGARFTATPSRARARGCPPPHPRVPAGGPGRRRLRPARPRAAPRSDRARGDLVIVYEGFNKQKAVTLTEKGQYQNRYGSFFHREWVGKPFGAKVYGKGEGKGFVWLLAPTPELWTKVLPHRTQILYAPDISLVAHALELKPGSVVLESGTGSASLTHALVRAVAPKGHVYDLRVQPRARRGGEPRDPRAPPGEAVHGFAPRRRARRLPGVPGAPVRRGVPGPARPVEGGALGGARTTPRWRAVRGSPCIEQVQRTREALEARGLGTRADPRAARPRARVETRDGSARWRGASRRLQNAVAREGEAEGGAEARGRGGSRGDGRGRGRGAGSHRSDARRAVRRSRTRGT